MEDDLRPDEVDLVGQWLDVGSRLVSDGVTARIERLIRSRLERVAADETGWATLYRDPRDGRFWERTFPRSEMHGGGPPRLTVISRQAAAEKSGEAAG